MPKPMPPPAELIRLPLVLQPSAGDVVIERDIVYGENKLLADIYRPAEGGRGPVVIFIHGGPVPADKTQPKDWRIFTDYGRLAASSGFIGVTFNHGFFGAGEFARATSNVEALIDHVRGESDRIFLWAFSGGGPFLSAGLDPARRYIRGLISYYAALDKVTATLKAAGGCPPMFIARAGNDMQPINAAVQQFVDAALTYNIEIELMNHPTGEHGFDILNDDERSRAIIRRTIEFIREH
jgi:acetyl esterase/lipase